MVFLLEKSPVRYKFIDLRQSGNDTILDQNARVFTYALRDAMDLVGTDTEIIGVDGTSVKGQLVQESKDGVGILAEGVDYVEVIPNDKIARRYLRPYDPAVPLGEQVPYLDVVITDNG